MQRKAAAHGSASTRVSTASPICSAQLSDCAARSELSHKMTQLIFDSTTTGSSAC
jgi:hypothetical protein